MPLGEWISIATAATAIVIAGAGVLRDRKTPVLQQAQADGAVIDAEAVKAEVKRANNELNVQRDLRILDLERWGDRMRPWTSAVKARDDVMCDLIREDRRALNLPMPEIAPLPDAPEFPPPRAL